MKRMLITGGAGFLGSHLAEKLLARGDVVNVVDIAPKTVEYKIKHLLHNPKFTLYRGSILDKDLMDKLIWNCDQVFHLAAIVGVEKYMARPYDVLEVNICGTKLVLDLAFKYNKKVIFTSTSEIYGKNTKVPFREDDDRVLGSTTIDRWCYSSSKAVGEHFCFAYCEKGLPVVVLRIFNAYGPRLDTLEGGRVISIFIGELLRNEPLTIIDGGEQTRCFTYIDDTIEGIIRASEVSEAEGKAINIGTDTETKIIDLARLMIAIYGADVDIKSVKGESIYGKGYEDIRRRVPDITRAKSILDFKPNTSLEDGLKRTITWFKGHYKNE